MSILDGMIAALVLWDLYSGFRAGAMKTVLGLVSWLIGLVAATKLAASVAPMFADITQSPILQMALGFLTVFLVVIGLLQLIVYMSSKAFKALRLDFIDKMAGGVLGAAKGVLKVLVLLSIIAPVLSKLPMWDDSPLAKSLLPFSPMAKQLIYKAGGDVYQMLQHDHK